MVRTLSLYFLLSLASAVPVLASPVEFNWAFVGNAGNAADPETGYGAVAYNYSISKTEVTNAQYVAFLNEVDPTGANTLGLFNVNMIGDFGGIELQASNPNGSKFVAQPGREQHPVAYVTYLDAMRFTNWLHNGQGSGDTETGAYTIGNGVNEVRSASARYWIPSEDEWYKAAYHDAKAGTAGVYFDFATGSDSNPISDQPGDNPSAVNYYNDDGLANGFNDGYAVSGSTQFSSNTMPHTDVRAFIAAVSPYGTFDQNGNVAEWNDTATTDTKRGLRGGGWGSGLSSLRSDIQGADNFPLLEISNVGFRVATVPEPNALLMGVLAVVWLALRRLG